MATLQDIRPLKLHGHLPVPTSRLHMWLISNSLIPPHNSTRNVYVIKIFISYIISSTHHLHLLFSVRSLSVFCKSETQEKLIILTLLKCVTKQDQKQQILPYCIISFLMETGGGLLSVILLCSNNVYVNMYFHLKYHSCHHLTKTESLTFVYFMKSVSNYPSNITRLYLHKPTLLHGLLTPNINKHSMQWHLHNESYLGEENVLMSSDNQKRHL